MNPPMAIPAEFDPVLDMLRHETEYGVFHETRKSCRFACELVCNGAPADLTVAASVLKAVLQCQATHPADVHQGNFRWMAEDDHIEDLNAVVFCLEHLIPMMLKHGHRLPLPLQGRVERAIQLGLQEVRHLDVWVGYTNIAALALLALCLGGDLLEDPGLRRQGQDKLQDWIVFTSCNGHVLEYNSPTYAAVTIRALAQLRDTVQCPDTALLAEIMLSRLGLSFALHLHKATGRLAGPHARAYQPSITGAAAPELQQFRQWLANGILPAWLARLRDQLPATYAVREGILSALECEMTTYVTPSFALGSTSRSLHPQGNHVIAHHVAGEGERAGVFYTRYILDDKWLGDFYHPTDRSNTRNLLDEGEFLGTQHNRALLGCYAPRIGNAMFRSAKASFIWTRAALVRQVRVNDVVVDRYPCAAPHDSRIVVTTDSTHYVLQPLHVSSLLSVPTLVLDRRAGDLVCDLYHYKAEQPKRFWDLNWPGAFYKGRPACLFYLELVDRSAVSSYKALAAYMTQVHLDCQIAPAHTRTRPAETRLLQARAEGPAGALAMAIDLMDFAFARPGNTMQGKETAKLESPVAVQRQQSFDLCGTHVTVARGNITFCQTPDKGEWHLIQTDPAGCRLEVAIGKEVHAIQTSGMALVHGVAGRVAVRALGENAL